MPPPPFLDVRKLDCTNLIADRDDILELNPHRHEFALLDGICYSDPDAGLFAGFHDIREDAWWVRGHIPGRPLFPGVLMIEVSAQLSSYITHAVLREDRFIGFAGVDDVKFRGAIAPPARFIVVGQAREIRPRRTISAVQGFVDDTMVFEGIITGMPV